MCTLLQCAVFYASYVAIVIAGVKSSNQNFATLFNETTGIINLRLPVVLPHFYFLPFHSTDVGEMARKKKKWEKLINKNCYNQHISTVMQLLSISSPSAWLYASVCASLWLSCEKHQTFHFELECFYSFIEFSSPSKVICSENRRCFTDSEAFVHQTKD